LSEIVFESIVFCDIPPKREWIILCISTAIVEDIIETKAIAVGYILLL
jgi:hypothetical protein